MKRLPETQSMPCVYEYLEISRKSVDITSIGPSTCTMTLVLIISCNLLQNTVDSTWELPYYWDSNQPHNLPKILCNITNKSGAYLSMWESIPTPGSYSHTNSWSNFTEFSGRNCLFRRSMKLRIKLIKHKYLHKIKSIVYLGKGFWGSWVSSCK